MTCPAVILAAGEGKRVGRPKALIEIGGRTMLQIVLEGCDSAGFSPLIAVVLPALEAEIRERHPTLDTLLVNPHPQSGPLGSLLIALDMVERLRAPGFLMAMVDFVQIQTTTYTALGEAVHRDPTRLWRPVVGERHGHPIWFPSSLFPALRECPPDQGPRAVVYAHQALWGSVTVHDSGIFRDIDTATDLIEAQSEATPPT